MDSDLTRDEPDVEPDAPSDEDELVPQPLVNRYAVPVSALVGGVAVAEADQVVIQPVPHGDPGGDAPGGVGGDGDGD